MKLFIILLLVPQLVFAECDYSTIKKVNNGYLYSKECHIETGKSLNELNMRKEQVEKLQKSLTFKDLALGVSNKRIINYQELSYKNTERLNRINSIQSKTNMLYFIGGIVTSVLSIYAASRAIGD